MSKKLWGAKFFLAGVFFVSSAVSAFSAQSYEIDKVHSSIGFSIAHMMVSRTTGTFDDYTGKVVFSADDLANSVIDFDVKAAGVNTNNKTRDDHLRGAEFFDVEAYPDIVFKSKKIESTGTDTYLVTGDLTMKAVTKEIQVPITVLGPVANPMGKGTVLGIEAKFQINRQDYGVNWSKVMDNGGLIVGNMVNLDVNIEAHAAPAE